MKIAQIDNGKHGYFAAFEDNKEAGRMVYTWTESDKFIINHTEVNSGFESKGVGKELLMKEVEFAREKQFKILPLYPFAKSMSIKCQN